MIRRPALVWLIFVSLSLGAAAALGWLTSQTLELERKEGLARRKAEQEERVRRALWRMDALLMPLIVREASRPDAFYNTLLRQSKSHNSQTQAAEANGSNELSDDYVLAHFQLHSDNRLLAPPSARISGRVGVAELRSLLSYSRLIEQLPEMPRQAVAAASAESLSPSGKASELEQTAQSGSTQSPSSSASTSNRPNPSQVVESFAQQSVRTPQAADQDAQRRNSVFQAFANPQNFEQRSESRPAAPGDPGAPEGMSRALWVGPELVLARRVARRGVPDIQGCVLDWNRLSARLREETAGILSEFDFAPARIEEASQSLATLPVRLIVPAPTATPEQTSGVRVALALAWGGLVIAASAAAATLRSVLLLAERRAAFVAAVTHELRTPLTTFRIYADMLAEGMVPAENRARYLETLRVEADRLGHLVDNVLQYARLERGRPRVVRQTIAAGDLVERLRPRLAARAAQANLELMVQVSPEADAQVITVDTAAVEQILFNLIDNACKYAATGSQDHISLEVNASPRSFVWQVRDFGPGISHEQRRRLFQPFSKTVDQAAVSAPGVGLGLALSRRLARELGGELRLESTGPEGTMFTLELPRKARIS